MYKINSLVSTWWPSQPANVRFLCAKLMSSARDTRGRFAPRDGAGSAANGPGGGSGLRPLATCLVA